jgi:transposase-like protein
VTDPRKLRLSELCRLLNSTPLGEVINERQLQRHRTRAGLRIGDARHVDLVRYVAWLVQVRHAPKPKADDVAESDSALAQAAQGAAALGSRWKQMEGHGQKLTSKQEALIAALLTERTYADAAAKAGVGQTTLYRWLHLRAFRLAYRRARRELVEAAIGRIQAATGQAVETLLAVARYGRRDADRVRAANALLDHASRGLAEADVLHGEHDGESAAAGDVSQVDAGQVVRLLAARLRQIDQSELPTAEKARLTASLTDPLLRAISVDVLDKRLEALQSVLTGRKDRGKR